MLLRGRHLDKLNAVVPKGPRCDSCRVRQLIRLVFSSPLLLKEDLVLLDSFDVSGWSVQHKYRVVLVLLLPFQKKFYSSKLHRLIICHLY